MIKVKSLQNQLIKKHSFTEKMKSIFSILLFLSISISGYCQSYWQQEAHYQMDITNKISKG